MHTSLRFIGTAGFVSLCIAGAAFAQQQTATVDISKITADGVGERIGTVKITETKKGVTLAVSVKDIPAGAHGFHVHEKGDCGPGMKDGKSQAGLAAGPHFDPESKKTHKGPHGAGHKGDLPVLKAGAKGISQTVTASRLKLAEIRGRSLMIHEGGDNYSDKPENGGGAGRIACGVIPKG
jgi:Cu-Zn family superoxide dismutase